MIKLTKLLVIIVSVLVDMYGERRKNLMNEVSIMNWCLTLFVMTIYGYNIVLVLVL